MQPVRDAQARAVVVRTAFHDRWQLNPEVLRDSCKEKHIGVDGLQPHLVANRSAPSPRFLKVSELDRPRPVDAYEISRLDGIEPPPPIERRQRRTAPFKI